MPNKKITDAMIGAALEGQDLTQEAANSDIVRALHGEPTAAQQSVNDLIAESLDSETRPFSFLEPADGKSDDIWIADLALESADGALGTALMRKHPGLTAYDLSLKARNILAECYKEATEASTDEAERRHRAADKAKQIAAEMNTPTPAAESDRPQVPATVRESKAPTAEADADLSGPIVIVYEDLEGNELHRRRLTKAEEVKLAGSPGGYLAIEQARRVHEVKRGNATP
ncbi:hypothetical protein GCM10027417_24050 [Glutamicibacter endophyticus]